MRKGLHFEKQHGGGVGNTFRSIRAGLVDSDDDEDHEDMTEAMKTLLQADYTTLKSSIGAGDATGRACLSSLVFIGSRFSPHRCDNHAQMAQKIMLAY